MAYHGAGAMRPPPRFFTSSAPRVGEIASVDDAEMRHMRRVMRLKAGARLVLLGPGGIKYEGELVGYEARRALVRVSAVRTQSPRARLILAPALIKGPRMDFLVEKAAELGATDLWPTICARSVARAQGNGRMERWHRLAMAAAKQSLAPAVLEVRPPRPFGEMLKAVPRATLALLCVGGAKPLGSVLRETRPRAILLACGPEGDFSPDEAAAAERAGFITVGLGPNRLRSETAALAGLSIASGYFAELCAGG